jgi:hypothetical protein
MESRKKLRRTGILVIAFLAIISFACGWLIGWIKFLKSIIFLLVPLTLIMSGSYYLLRHSHEKGRSLLIYVWYGFCFGIASVIGMLLDPRIHNFHLLEVIEVFGIIWICSFLFMLIFTPLAQRIISIFQPVKRLTNLSSKFNKSHGEPKDGNSDVQR